MILKGDKKLPGVIFTALLTAAAMVIFSSQLYSQDSRNSAESAAVTSNPAQPEKIRIQLHWYPQAQFAGFLTAVKKGFFSEEGLDVKIRWGGAGILPLKELKDGNVEFCTAWLSQAIASSTDDNTPCVLLAQQMPKSSMMLITRKKSDINTPVQMTGKKIGIWGGDFSIAPTAFFEKYDIKPVIIMQSASVLPFIRGVVDVASAMYYNEYHKLMEAGISKDELNIFMLADYGLDFPEDGIYTTADFREKHPDICRKMITAIQKGWQYSFAHKDETIDAIIQEATEYNFVTNANHQKWMLDAMEKLIPMKTANSQSWGYLSPSTYANVCEILQRQKLLKNTPPAYVEFYQPAATEPAKTSDGGDAK
ncbi:MAG TPA: ABC transporter substrate-binding protein [Phycisphaerae bacterium]|nr:ABC transporter substrate-binding protein [Phycisphaerae bacterium]HPS52627.1 ABC transporter substrate-binding protein [Phycisphaerae bacterium]